MCSGGGMQFYCRVQQQLEGFPLRMSGIDNSYKIDGDVLLVIHASIPPGVELGPGPTLPRGRRIDRSSVHCYTTGTPSTSCC